MKNILYVLFLLVSLTSFGQIKKVDTTEICLPYSVGKQIMLDLNRLDSTTAILKLTETEVIELNKKIDAQQGIIGNLEDKVKMSDTIIQKSNEKSYETSGIHNNQAQPHHNDGIIRHSSMHKVVLACANCEPIVIYQKSTEENH